jgi:hypothetical protein
VPPHGFDFAHQLGLLHRTWGALQRHQRNCPLPVETAAESRHQSPSTASSVAPSPFLRESRRQFFAGRVFQLHDCLRKVLSHLGKIRYGLARHQELRRPARLNPLSLHTRPRPSPRQLPRTASVRGSDPASSTGAFKVIGKG